MCRLKQQYPVNNVPVSVCHTHRLTYHTIVSEALLLQYCRLHHYDVVCSLPVADAECICLLHFTCHPPQGCRDCWVQGVAVCRAGQQRHLILLPGGGSVGLRIYCTLVSESTILMVAAAAIHTPHTGAHIATVIQPTVNRHRCSLDANFSDVRLPISTSVIL